MVVIFSFVPKRENRGRFHQHGLPVTSYKLVRILINIHQSISYGIPPTNVVYQLVTRRLAFLPSQLPINNHCQNARNGGLSAID